MINIVDILKDCPKGTKLYSPLCGDCKLLKIYNGLGFDVINDTYDVFNFSYDGRYNLNGECCIFPSKNNRDWNKFRPFKDGDIISNDVYIAIFHKFGKPYFCAYNKVVYYHCWCHQIGNDFKFKKDFGIGRDTDYRFATDGEKQKLFNIIKANGYKWNAETKTLEKLIVPKFKVGDKIVKKDDSTKSWYVQGIDTYCNSDYYYIVTKSQVSNLHFKDQDNWELVPTHKFKVGDIVKSNTNKLFDYKIIKITDTHYTLESIPGANTYDMLICEDENWKLVPNKFNISTLKAYDKVLVRDDNNSAWVNTFFGFYDTVTNKKYPFIAGTVNWVQCIPYEGNEHLLGTCDECNEYYKNW